MFGLTALRLEDNEFEGRIDDNFLTNHKVLLHIDLSDNDFTGTVPPHFFEPTSIPFLETLDLHGNRLTGQLPDFSPNVALEFLLLG